jgi:hypothetical protein
MLFQTLRTNSGNSGNLEFQTGHFCAIGKLKFVPENIFFTEYALRRVPGISGKSGHFRTFFSEMSQFAKKVQKWKNAKNAKRPENTWNFGCFIENRAVAICRSIEKVSKMTKSRAHPHFFPKFREGHFGVFDFQLRIEVKFRKKAFSTFLKKIFTFFAFYRLEVDGPIFYKIWTSLFFEKCGTRFRFWVRFCAAFTEKIRPDENDDAYRLPL